MERDAEADRTAVAKAAGLSKLHGGGEQPLDLRYEVECPTERGLMLVVERSWEVEQGTPPVDMFLVCPVCGEEHTLIQKA